MIPLTLTLTATSLLLCRLLIAHLMVVNDGSRTAEHALVIDDITLSQAFYGQLQANTADYYQFDVTRATDPRLSLLVPQRHHAAGFRPTLIISGPGMPAQGLMLPAGDMGTRMGTTAYQRTHQPDILVQPGRYLVAVRAEQAGVYCFCCGTREPAEYASEATRARVKALLEG
jgi:hypothetical protein